MIDVLPAYAVISAPVAAAVTGRSKPQGDRWLDVQFIGDRDSDRMAEYVQQRTDALEGAADLLDRGWTEAVIKPSSRRRAGFASSLWGKLPRRDSNPRP
ncbi:MAG TPA: hypothetical protein VM716_00435, partial [Gemmatimonadales bacterium]|nr:hypothetical protein [Gemmatimonadales bacterium]